MSCDTEKLDALVHGELSPSDAAAAATHVATCPSCAKELRFLSAEREAFHRRSENAAPLPRVRKATLAALDHHEPSRLTRVGFALALSMSVCLLALSFIPRHGSSTTSLRVDGPLMSFCAAPNASSCEDVPQTPVFSRALHSGGELVAEAEGEFHACLVASPIAGDFRLAACE